MENKRKTILFVVVSSFLVLVIGAFFLLWNPTPPPKIQMPVPNGYADFVKAGALVQKQTPDFATMSPVQLRDLVDANSNALQTARSGLALKSRVPLDFSQPYVDMLPLQRMKMLAYAFLAEGRLAEIEQRTNAAAQSYLDAVRLGINCRQGGVLIDALVGFAVEALGTHDLQRLVPNLDAKTSAEMAHQLEIAQSDQEAWDQILQNEKYWTRQAFPGLQFRVAELFTASGLKAARAKAKQKYEAGQNKTHQLMLDLAAHAYQLDKGNRPINVADLVPAYLKAAPIDPLTGKEMTLTP